jgi:chemotaxis protein MotB
MARHFLPLAACVFFLGGCVVGQDKYAAKSLETEQLRQRVSAAENEAASARSEAVAYKTQLDRLLANDGNARDLINNQAQQIAQLRADYAALNEKYNNALAQSGSIIGGPVDQELASELTRLAQQYPDIMEFNAATGMVKLKSDVTFARGSAEVTAQAKQVIDRVAQALNTPAARRYEFLVAGHTDNTPVVQRATIAEGHKDNWYLSAHRAISVSRELMSQGISPRRLGVLGYADQRPVAPNSTSEGQARNRRVEILILPSTYSGAVAAAPAAAAPPRPARADLNKDSVNADPSPLFNK